MEEPFLSTPVGARRPDSEGAAVAVARIDPARSYVGTGALLQRFLNGTSEEPWHAIKAKVDYTYESLDLALGPLNSETGFAAQVKERVSSGKKLLFKPNLVEPLCIDPETHAPARGSYTCTEWSFVAALMRWFHDRLGIRYAEMCLAEAASAMTVTAARLSSVRPGLTVTTEAVIEGRSDELYGGWGFYFVRKYLAESGRPTAGDDPMNGFQESVRGLYVPPGRADNKLLVYDLNRIADDPRRGRAVTVSDGANFKSITLHKAVVGGDPADAADRADYPGCVLINVPKLKVHAISQLTNIIKNLGIGLYPMHSHAGTSSAWEYAVPDGPLPGMKARIPHVVWTAELDSRTLLPREKPDGKPMLTRTAGMPGTMVDVIRAVLDQDVFAIHVVDGIESRNLDHQGVVQEPAVKVAEGIIVAGLDPVAADLFSARYLFCNVGIAEAEKAGLDDGNGGRFPQRVPIPAVEGPNIVGHVGYDCPLARNILFGYAERRGIGRRMYHVLGSDVVTGTRLVSVDGHLGSAIDGAFRDVHTATLYFDTFKMPWDLQRTSLSYLQAVDELTGSQLKQELLADYDETGSGSFSYEEFGRAGTTDSVLQLMGRMLARTVSDEDGDLRASFEFYANVIKLSSEAYNAAGKTLFKGFARDGVLVVAKTISELQLETPDPFLPSLTFGKGKWPSYQLAAFTRLGGLLYGNAFPFKVQFPSLYGTALYYADRTQNRSQYGGPLRFTPDPDGVQRYVDEVVRGKASALDFVLYVPPGYGSLAGMKLPNVEETSEPARLFTAAFEGGEETWPAPERDR